MSEVPNKRSKPTAKVEKEPLSRERIELCALALIEEVGLEAFSTRKLGTKLGCEAMSIYNHFPSKAHLFDALVDRVLCSAYIPPRELNSIDRLRGLAQGWRDMAKRHKRFFPIFAVRRFNSETGVRYLNEILLTLKDAGLDTQAAYQLYRVIAHYLMGTTLEEIARYSEESSSLNPMNKQDLMNKYPQVAAVEQYDSLEHFDLIFEFGLNAILRGVGLLETS